MTQISDVMHFIRTAKQEKTERNKANYLGFLASEFGECLKEIDDHECQHLSSKLEILSKRIRSGYLDAKISQANQVQLMDAAFDSAWCALGLMHMLGHAPHAWAEGAGSNYSKFNHDGTASLTPDGKVIKGPKFHKPDFSKCVD